MNDAKIAFPDGVKVGHAVHEQVPTGCTVFLCPENTVGSVDVRGPAPGSRETALLGLDKRVIYVNAVVLTGGSAFGLATADGVMRYLGERDIGHFTPIKRIPIVPTAVVYDLLLTKGAFLPDAAMGYAACQNAHADNTAQGNVGAGAGVTVGKWCGLQGSMKGGLGVASARAGELLVTVTAVVNAVGDVVDEDGSVLAGAKTPDGRWAVADHPWRFVAESQMPLAQQVVEGSNTTLVVVACNGRFDKTEVNRLAQRAHDGMAMAIHPIHTTHDGDTAFALATGQVDAPFNLAGNMTAVLTAQAIRQAVRHAHTVGEAIGLAG